MRSNRELLIRKFPSCHFVKWKWDSFAASEHTCGQSFGLPNCKASHTWDQQLAIFTDVKCARSLSKVRTPNNKTCLSQPNLHKNVNRGQVFRAILMTISRKVLGGSEWKPTLYAQMTQMAEILQSHQIWRCFVQFAECSSHRFSKFKNSFTSEQLHLFRKMKRSVWHVLAGGQVCRNMQFYTQNAIKTRWGNSKNEVGPHNICQQLPSSAYGWSFKKVSRFPVVSLTWRDAQPAWTIQNWCSHSPSKLHRMLRVKTQEIRSNTNLVLSSSP